MPSEGVFDFTVVSKSKQSIRKEIEKEFLQCSVTIKM